MEEKYLKAEEVAKKLRVSLITVHRYCKDGKLPAIKVGRRWLVDRVGLDALLAGGGLAK